MLFALADACVAPKSSSHLESDWSLVLPPSAEKKRVREPLEHLQKYMANLISNIITIDLIRMVM